MEFAVEECPKCGDGIVKTHEVDRERNVLICLECGNKQKYEDSYFG